MLTLLAACITLMKKVKLSNLLVFSGLVFEVIYSLPEESDTEQTAVMVFEQQPVGEDKGPQINTRAQNMWCVCVETYFSRFALSLEAA